MLNTTVKPTRPLLRWAGSKSRDFSKYSPYFPTSIERYIEPFCGSASFFFKLQPKEAVLNDINSKLINFYRAASAHPTLLYSKFIQIERNRETYLSARSTYNESQNDIDSAILFYYLNRNSFNGIYRENTRGHYNVPFSSARVSPYLDHDQFISSTGLLRNATFTCSDFQIFIEDNVTQRDFLFIDPPYYSNNSRIFTEYTSIQFCASDINRLKHTLQIIVEKGASFLLTFPASSVGKELANDWYTRSISVRRTVGGSSRTLNQSEIVIASYPL